MTKRKAQKNALPKKSSRRVVTSDSDEPVLISNKIDIAKLKALAKQQRKTPTDYLHDLIDYHYLYI